MSYVSYDLRSPLDTKGTSNEDAEGDTENESESKDGQSIDDLEILDFDSLESDLEDAPENVRSKAFIKLRKKSASSGINNNFYVGKEFLNKDLAKARIKANSIESSRNMEFMKNDKKRIRVTCKGVVPTLSNKDVFVDKVQGPKEDISIKVLSLMFFEEVLVQQSLRKTVNHVLELSSCIYLC
nr:transposase, mutator type [Tanacetum cinerariifolium]